MSEHGLNHAKALAALEQVGREGVAKRMQRNRLAQPRGFGGLLEQSTELTRGQWLMLTAAWKQILCRRSERKAATSSVSNNTGDRRY